MTSIKQLQRQIDLLIEAIVTSAKKDEFLKAVIAKNQELERFKTLN